MTIDNQNDREEFSFDDHSGISEPINDPDPFSESPKEPQPAQSGAAPGNAGEQPETPSDDGANAGGAGWPGPYIPAAQYRYTPAAPQETPPQSQPPQKSGKGPKIAIAILATALILTVIVSFSVIAALLVLRLRGPASQRVDTEVSRPVNSDDPGGKPSARPDDKSTAPSEYHVDDWVNPGDLTDPNAVVNVAAKCSPSVVTVNVELSSGSGSGSGVVWSSDGYIVTNNHVVEDALAVNVVLENNHSYPATVIALDAENDLALLRIRVSGLYPASIGDSASLKVGQTAIVIGNPLGTLANSVTEGIISSLARDINVEGTNMHLMQVTAAVNPGNSGGGCFDINGNLIGIVNSKKFAAGIEGLGFAIPVDTVKTVVSQMIADDTTTLRKSFGITQCYEITEENYADYRRQFTLLRRIEELNGSPIYGIYIGSDGLVDYVDPENTFENGDVIRTVNGKEIKTLSDINALLDGMNTGDELTVVVTRLVSTSSGFRQNYSLKEVTLKMRVIEMYR